METPKEKAQSLVEKFKAVRVFEDITGGFPLDDTEAVNCAKIAVEEILNDIPDYLGNINPKRFYWEEVLYELNKL